jgi:Ca-activated chloride channel family protein
MLESVFAFTEWQWKNPETLWFALLPLVWWIISRLLAKKQINQYADNHLLAWVKVETNFVKQNLIQKPFSNQKSPGGGSLDGLYQLIKGIIVYLVKGLFNPILLLSFAWILVTIALAGPRSAIPTPDNYSRAGVDIMVAFDLSSSMTAQDVKPNRFLLARSLIESFSNRLEPNDRLALLGYAGQPHLVMPLSFDRDIFQHYLALLRPKMLPTKGSQIKPAIAYGVQHLEQTAGKAKVLVVFTDGEPKNFIEQAEPQGFSELAKSKVKIILVGVGERTRVKIPDAEHHSGYLHLSGLLVKSRLEESFLQELSIRLGGDYIKSSRGGDFIENLVSAITLDAETRYFQSNKTVWQDHGIPFVWLAFIAFLFAFYPIKIRSKTNLAPILLIGLIFNFLPTDSVAVERETKVEQQAYDAFLGKNFDLSQQLYDGLDNFKGWFGAGSAAYFAEDYESAVQYFRQSALMGNSVKNRSDALFNLGNSYYRANLLPQAIESYQQALHYLPDNEKTKHNLALVKQRRQLEKGQQQKDEQGEGKGEGSQSRDDSGAFYGGQKPSQNEQGEGGIGDAPEGEKQGKEFVLPSERNDTNFELKAFEKMKLTATGNAILAKQQQIKRMEKFEQQMERVQDKQAELLIRIFEREEDFQAAQEKSHEIPGVKPW